MWLSQGWPAATGLDAACLRRRAAGPAAHDHLFHTLLGMLGVGTQLYEPAWDLGAGCRTPAASPVGQASAR
jgi:lipid A ethanolaminephosphotransferase